MKYYNLTLFNKIFYYEVPVAIEKDEDFEPLLNNIIHKCPFKFKKEEITKEEYERLLASKDFI